MIIFEDGPETNISKLLEHCSNVHISRESFVSGNYNVVGAIDRVNDATIAFVDCVPDNEATISNYNSSVLKASEKKGTVLVIPIPCIEYVVIRYLSTKYGEVQSLAVVHDLLSFSNYHDGYRKSSYETYCKSVLNNNPVSRCYRASRRYPKYAQYYKLDCKCGLPEGGRHFDIALTEKANDLMSFMARYFTDSSLSVGLLIESAKSLYKDMWSSISAHSNVRKSFEDMLWCDQSWYA